MADDKVTPIRPDVSVKSKRKRPTRGERRDGGIKDRLYGFQERIAHAAALARALALACDGQVMAFGVEPTEGCLGVAELLEGVQAEMYDLATDK